MILWGKQNFSKWGLDNLLISLPLERRHEQNPGTTVMENFDKKFEKIETTNFMMRNQWQTSSIDKKHETWVIRVWICVP